HERDRYIALRRFAKQPRPQLRFHDEDRRRLNSSQHPPNGPGPVDRKIENGVGLVGKNLPRDLLTGDSCSRNRQTEIRKSLRERMNQGLRRLRFAHRNAMQPNYLRTVATNPRNAAQTLAQSRYILPVSERVSDEPWKQDDKAERQQETVE